MNLKPNNELVNFERQNTFLQKPMPTHCKLQFIKAALLSQLHKVLNELAMEEIHLYSSEMETYDMDSKIVQMVIHTLVDSGEYTLEGIAYHTRIPHDVIYDAAYGKISNFSITTWVRVIDMYIQIKPEVLQLLFEKLLERNNELNGKNIDR